MPHRPRIGCSGWTCDDWKRPFRPETVKLKNPLAGLATADFAHVRGHGPVVTVTKS